MSPSRERRKSEARIVMSSNGYTAAGMTVPDTKLARDATGPGALRARL